MWLWHSLLQTEMLVTTQSRSVCFWLYGRCVIASVFVSMRASQSKAFHFSAKYSKELNRKMLYFHITYCLFHSNVMHYCVIMSKILTVDSFTSNANYNKTYICVCGDKRDLNSCIMFCLTVVWFDLTLPECKQLCAFVCLLRFWLQKGQTWRV